MPFFTSNEDLGPSAVEDWDYTSNSRWHFAPDLGEIEMDFAIFGKHRCPERSRHPLLVASKTRRRFDVCCVAGKSTARSNGSPLEFRSSKNLLKNGSSASK